MSVTLTYSVPNDLSQLADELRRAAALLTPPDDANNTPERVEGLGDDIILTMPAAVDTAAIDAIVAAHVPMTRYEPADQLASIATARDAARRRGEFARLQATFDAVSGVADVPEAGAQLIKLLRALYHDLGLL